MSVREDLTVLSLSKDCPKSGPCPGTGGCISRKDDVFSKSTLFGVDRQLVNCYKQTIGILRMPTKKPQNGGMMISEAQIRRVCKSWVDADAYAAGLAPPGEERDAITNKFAALVDTGKLEINPAGRVRWVQEKTVTHTGKRRKVDVIREACKDWQPASKVVALLMDEGYSASSAERGIYYYSSTGLLQAKGRGAGRLLRLRVHAKQDETGSPEQMLRDRAAALRVTAQELEDIADMLTQSTPLEEWGK